METVLPTKQKVLPWKRMDGPQKRKASYADIAALPDHKVGQLVDGDLYICGRPRIRHALALTKLMALLAPMFLESKTGWIFLIEPEIWFGTNRKNLLVPDLAAWRRSRVPNTGVLDVQTIELMPDWICEGLSPSTTRIDRGRKRELYAKFGVKHLWYADPARMEMEMLSLQRGDYRLAHVGTTETAAFPPFTHVIDLSKLWVF